jgi:hypothetical protein
LYAEEEGDDDEDAGTGGTAAGSAGGAGGSAAGSFRSVRSETPTPAAPAPGAAPGPGAGEGAAAESAEDTRAQDAFKWAQQQAEDKAAAGGAAKQMGSTVMTLDVVPLYPTRPDGRRYTRFGSAAAIQARVVKRRVLPPTTRSGTTHRAGPLSPLPQLPAHALPAPAAAPAAPAQT